MVLNYFQIIDNCVKWQAFPNIRLKYFILCFSEEFFERLKLSFSDMYHVLYY
jgi:hypothetical protein